MTANTKARFALGKLVATPGALAALTESGQSPQVFLARHIGGDWGECCIEDRLANDQSLLHGDLPPSNESVRKVINLRSQREGSLS